MEILRDVLEQIRYGNEKVICTNIYSSCTYANCNDNLLIGRFYDYENIGAWLLVQSVDRFDVKIYKTSIEANIYLKEI